MAYAHLRNEVLATVGAVALGGCASYYDPYYGGVSAGYGYPGGYYGSPYSSYDYGYRRPYYGYGYGSGYRQPYWGWYNGYYYPGTGFYVYDRFRRPYRWSDNQRRYWINRRIVVVRDRQPIRQNWRDFRHERREVRREIRRGDRRDDRRDDRRRRRDD